MLRYCAVVLTLILVGVCVYGFVGTNTTTDVGLSGGVTVTVGGGEGPAAGEGLLLEDDSGFVLLEDDSYFLLEE